MGIQKTDKQKKSVVVIGGGTGTYNLLRGLKQHRDTIDITKVVSMADSGGSNARIRDEFGLLPLSDINRSLAALSADVGDHGQLLRELFLYRFNKGQGVSGHNFGNLLLVALTEMLGNETEAIKVASRILRLRGTVLPVTEADIHLVATYDDGTVVIGEHDIDEPSKEREGRRIAQLATDIPAKTTPDVYEAIKNADVVVLGPGDLYTSLMANCVVDGVPQALQESKAHFVYIANLMTRPGQTRGMKLSEYLTEIERYLTLSPDTVLVNTEQLPKEALLRYQQEGDAPIEDDLCSECAIVREDFIASELVHLADGDALKRSYIRHDGHKLAAAIMKLI